MNFRAPNKLKSQIIGVVSVGISVGLLTFLLSRMDFIKAMLVLKQAEWKWLLLAAGAAAVLPFCGVCRWRGVLRAHKEFLPPYGLALRAIMFANALNIFCPSKTGDLAKAVYLRDTAGLSFGMGTVILERLVDLGILGIFGLAGSLITGKKWGVLVAGVLVAAVSTIFFCLSYFPLNHLSLSPRWEEKARELQSVFQRWKTNPGAIGATLFGSITTWLLASFIVCALVSSLGSSLKWGYILTIFPVAILAGLVPFTISGMGTRDSAFIFLLNSYLTTEAATLVGLGYTLFAYWFVGLLGFPVVIREVISFLRNYRISAPG